jgi:hypothetical protein
MQPKYQRKFSDRAYLSPLHFFALQNHFHISGDWFHVNEADLIKTVEKKA